MSLSDFVDCRARCERLEEERAKLADHCVVVINNGKFKNVWCTVCQARRTLQVNSSLKGFHRFDCLVKKVKGEG